MHHAAIMELKRDEGKRASKVTSRRCNDMHGVLGTHQIAAYSGKENESNEDSDVRIHPMMHTA